MLAGLQSFSVTVVVLYLIKKEVCSLVDMMETIIHFIVNQNNDFCCCGSVPPSLDLNLASLSTKFAKSCPIRLSHFGSPERGY